MADRGEFDPGVLATQRTIVLRFDLADPTLTVEVDLGDVAPALAFVVLRAGADVCGDEWIPVDLIHRGAVLVAPETSEGD